MGTVFPVRGRGPKRSGLGGWAAAGLTVGRTGGHIHLSTSGRRAKEKELASRGSATNYSKLKVGRKRTARIAGGPTRPTRKRFLDASPVGLRLFGRGTRPSCALQSPPYLRSAARADSDLIGWRPFSSCMADQGKSGVALTRNKTLFARGVYISPKGSKLAPFATETGVRKANSIPPCPALPLGQAEGGKSLGGFVAANFEGPHSPSAKRRGVRGERLEGIAGDRVRTAERPRRGSCRRSTLSVILSTP